MKLAHRGLRLVVLWENTLSSTLQNLVHTFHELEKKKQTSSFLGTNSYLIALTSKHIIIFNALLTYAITP